jgi:hypothetical protein
MCKRYIGNASKIVWKDGGVCIKCFNLPCNKWDCEDCAKRKAIILGNRVKAGFQGERVRFATFTDNGEGTLRDRLQMLKTAWNRLRLDLSRQYGLTKFFWVLEFGGKRGRPHLHCLLNCYIPQRKLSELAAKCGFGSVVDIREVKNGGGFGYVFKYLSKDCGLKAGSSALKSINGRRFGLSRNIPPIRSNPTTSCTATYSNDVCAPSTLADHAKMLAGAFMSKIDTFVTSSSVATAKASDALPTCSNPDSAQLFLDSVGSWERLMLFGGGRFIAHGSKFVNNSYHLLTSENVFVASGGRTPLASALQS